MLALTGQKYLLGIYDAAWDEYEAIHNEEHPRRFYDRMAATAT